MFSATSGFMRPIGAVPVVCAATPHVRETPARTAVESGRLAPNSAREADTR
jgi:hypothetical protein